MKLLETTYNPAYPSFKIAKMNDESVGVPFGESLTIQLSDRYVEYQGKTLSGPAVVNTIEYKVTEKNKKKGQNVGDTTSFDKCTITGKVIGDNVENIQYNQYENATFEVSDSITKKLLAVGKEEIKNITIELTLDKFEKEIDGKTQTIKYFKISKVNDDGSMEELGGNSSSSPKPAQPQPPGTLPPAIEEMNKSVCSVELSDVEKSIFKEVRTNSEFNNKTDENSWINYAKVGVDEFKTMLGTIANYLSLTYVVDEGRVEQLLTKFKEV